MLDTFSKFLLGYQTISLSANKFFSQIGKELGKIEAFTRIVKFFGASTPGPIIYFIIFTINLIIMKFAKYFSVVCKIFLKVSRIYKNFPNFTKKIKFNYKINF